MRPIRLYTKLVLRRFWLIPSFCKKCGRDVRDFVVPDPVWEKVEALIPHGSVLCYECFCDVCEEAGLPSVWELWLGGRDTIRPPESGTTCNRQTECDCLSYNQPKPDQRTPEVVLEAPEWSARKTICVDACIAHVIAHLWENGVITRGCCCGHGKRRPSVVLGESQDPRPVPGLIAQVDDREWDILQWVLVRPLLLTEGMAVKKI